MTPVKRQDKQYLFVDFVDDLSAERFQSDDELHMRLLHCARTEQFTLDDIRIYLRTHFFEAAQTATLLKSLSPRALQLTGLDKL